MTLGWLAELWESGTLVGLGYFEGKPFQEEWDDSKVKRGGSAGLLAPKSQVLIQLLELAPKSQVSS